MSRWQRWATAAAFLVGTAVRLLYVFIIHPAPQHIYSDMQGYVEWALRYFSATPQSIADTIHPPGTPIFFAALHAMDPSWNLAGVTQAALSVGIMVLLWAIARMSFGTHVATLTVILTAVYFPLIHYAGLFLAENPFTFFMIAGLWALLHARRAVNARRALGWGLLAGILCGLAGSFKNAVLGPFAVTGVGYAIAAIRQRQPYWVNASIGAVLGLAVLFIPMTYRCTRLAEGHFCPGATNTTMNILMGHFGKVGPFYWHDRPRHIEFMFQSPTTVVRGYTTPVHLSFGAYDSAANLDLALRWISEHPGEALELSCINIFDLFGIPTLWPAAVYFNIDWGAIWQYVYWLAMLLPAVLHIGARGIWGTLLQRGPRLGEAEMFLILPLLGMMLTVFLSVSEVRYRIPFDGLMIVLAAQAYVEAANRLRKTRTQSS